MKKKTKIEIVKITYDCVYIYLLDCKKKNNMWPKENFESTIYYFDLNT